MSNHFVVLCDQAALVKIDILMNSHQTGCQLRIGRTVIVGPSVLCCFKKNLSNSSATISNTYRQIYANCLTNLFERSMY